MARTRAKKSIRLPKDIEHGCAWLTPRGYIRWQVRIDGKTKTSENKDREAAFEAMRRAIGELTAGTSTVAAGSWHKASIRAWTDEVVTNRAPHLEQTTRDLYHWVIGKWVLSFNDWTPLGQIDKQWISTLRSRLIEALFAKEMSWHHYRNITTAFGLCLREAWDADILADDLSVHLRLKKAERKKLVIEGRIKPRATKGRRYLSAQDWAKLIQSLVGHWLYGPALLGSFTGMRTAEVAGLKWSAVHLDVDVPFVEITSQVKRIRGGGLADKRPKYNSVGAVELVEPVVLMLRQLVRNSEYVFVNRQGKPLDVSAIDRALKLRVEQLEVKCLDGSPPVFTDLARRALASERQRAGLPAIVGAQIARHSEEMQESVYEQESREESTIRRENLAVLSTIYASRLSALAS